MSLQKIYGRHAVLEALRSEHAQVKRVLMSKGGHGAVLRELEAAAEARGVEVEYLERKRFDKLAGPVVHQGVMAQTEARAYADLEDVLRAAALDLPNALLVVSDEIEDPRNLGAIARCAEGAGAQGLVITSHHSAEVTPVA
jgi:23S rRNA (guanosine2251-2'-O)-methyltransferase